MRDGCTTQSTQVLDERRFSVGNLVRPSFSTQLQTGFYSLIHTSRSHWITTRLQSAKRANRYRACQTDSVGLCQLPTFTAISKARCFQSQGADDCVRIVEFKKVDIFRG